MQRSGIKSWVCLSEGAGGTLGWLTTNERKEAMCLQLRDALKVGCIALSDQFFSTTMDAAVAVRQIREELCRFSIITEPARTVFAKPRKTFSGKLGGQQDDMAVVLQLAVTGIRQFYTSSKYDSFRAPVY